jgi:hypothetical protein
MNFLKMAVYVFCCLYLPSAAWSQEDLGNPNVCIVIVEMDCLGLSDIPCKGATYCNMSVGGNGICQMTHEVEPVAGTYDETYFVAMGYSSVATISQTSCYRARRCRTECINTGGWQGGWVCDWNLGGSWYDAQILYPVLQGAGICP